MPGARSLRLQQYYAHSQNSFWIIMESICGANPRTPYSEKAHRLEECGIAIWDVLQYCEREGSLDSNINSETEMPNDFEEFLHLRPNIIHIFFNGQKARNSFNKLVRPKLPQQIGTRISLITLPSTSPANTHLSVEEKQAEWHKQMRTAFKIR